MRKEVPGIELFGGVTQDLAVGGINLAAVKQMASITGGYGKVVWLPTFDSEISVRQADGKGIGPYVPIEKDGKLLPSVLELPLLPASGQTAAFVFRTSRSGREP